VALCCVHNNRIIFLGWLGADWEGGRECSSGDLDILHYVFLLNNVIRDEVAAQWVGNQEAKKWMGREGDV